MRAVILASDLFVDNAEECGAAMARLTHAGLQPVLLAAPHGAELPLSASAAVPVVALGEANGGRNGYAEALVRCATLVEVPLREAFFLGRSVEGLQTALELGLRGVLVLGGRSLDELLGPSEPVRKHFPVAPDTSAAVRYVLAEVATYRQLGAFPFAGQRPLGDRAGALVPTASDLARIFLIITAAGVAIALGIAYILQEVYQRFTFPPVAYWLTLQFIPQTYRGLLFLAIGAVAGLFAQRVWRRITSRRSSGGR